MDYDSYISSAISRVGVKDVLEWAKQHAAVPLVELNRMLDAGIAPVDLLWYMARVAEDSDRYDEFVRTEAVRRLNERLPHGIAQPSDPDDALASAFSDWIVLIDPVQRPSAQKVWAHLKTTIQQQPDWRPSSPDDERLLDAFRGRSFFRTEESKKLRAVLNRMEEIVQGDTQAFDYATAVRSLKAAPPGFGWLFGIYTLDAEVSSGGFEQYFANTGGWPTELAAEGFRRMGAEELVQLVHESVFSALTHSPESLPRGSWKPSTDGHVPPRPLDQLDAAYCGFKRSKGEDWLEAAVTKLISSNAKAFDEQL